jgi:hypothetical protein
MERSQAQRILRRVLQRWLHKEVLRDCGHAALCSWVQGTNRQVYGANNTEDSIGAIKNLKHTQEFMLTPRYQKITRSHSTGLYHTFQSALDHQSTRERDTYN